MRIQFWVNLFRNERALHIASCQMEKYILARHCPSADNGYQTTLPNYGDTFLICCVRTKSGTQVQYGTREQDFQNWVSAFKYFVDFGNQVFLLKLVHQYWRWLESQHNREWQLLLAEMSSPFRLFCFCRDMTRKGWVEVEGWKFAQAT